MAEYGYSTPYRGTNIQPLPPGYMEAATAPGRAFGAAIASVGQNVLSAIQQYQKNRSEEDYLNAKIDAGLAQYAAAGQQGPLPSGATADLGNLVGILGEKNAKKLSEGTATKAEKLAISHALETYGQQELQALNRQAMIEQLQAARDKRLADRQIGELIRYGVNLPTTQEVQVPTTETLQPVGPMPAPEAPVSATGQPIDVGRYSQAAEGGRMGRYGINPSVFDMAAQREVQPAMAPVPAASAQPKEVQFMEPIQVQGTRTEQQQIPYQETRQQLAQFAAQQGMRPEAFAAIDTVLQAAGRQKPTTVEQVGDLGAVVKFGSHEQFVPKPKADISDMLKMRGLTINFPEYKGVAPTEKEASDFRDQYQTALASRQSIARLLEIARMGKVQQQVPSIKAEAEQLSRALKGAKRLEILGPGAVTDTDQKILDNVIRNPTDIFSLQSSNIKALEGMLERTGVMLDNKATAIGLQSVNNPQAQPQAGQAQYRFVPGKGIQPIR